MFKKVVVSVDEKGVTRTDYINFEGKECLAAASRFHQLLAQFGVQLEQTAMMPKPELLADLNQQETVTQSLEQQSNGKEE